MDHDQLSQNKCHNAINRKSSGKNIVTNDPLASSLMTSGKWISGKMKNLKERERINFIT